MIREDLKRLHELAGSPTVDSLKTFADQGPHKASRATLGAILNSNYASRPRWTTVAAFVDACERFARSKGRRLPAEEVDIRVWLTRYERKHPDQRPPSSRSEPRQVVGIVPQLADCFQTRDAVKVLTEVTTDGGTAVLTSAGTQLLSGMGGVGKTQLAVHLADHLRSAGRLDLLVWISATSRGAILAGYAQAGVELSVPGADDIDTEQDAARFHAWLTSTDRRWLIVLDDLTRTGDLQGLWPPPNPSGRTVVTTRLRGSALRGAGRHLVPIGTFTKDEATHYVHTRLNGKPALADDVSGLVENLGRLPLALAQATAFMIDEGVPCSRYRQRFADRRSRLDDLVPDPDGPTGLPDDYHRTVAATMSLSIETAERSRPAGLARPLLELASVLDPAGIPISVFTTTAALNWLTYRRSLTTDASGDLDAELAKSGLQCLHRLNLITIDAKIVSMHGLVQRATRELCSGEHIADLAWAAADALTETWPKIERDTAHAQRLRSNTTSVQEHGQDALLQPETHPLLSVAFNSLGTSGNPAGAVAAFEELLTVQLRVFGPDHPDTLVTRSNLAYWRGEAGDPAGAVAAFEELLTDHLRVLGPDHPNTLATRNNLAYWRGEAGDPAGAATAFEELLTDQVRVLGPDHPNTLATRANLAYWRGEAGDPAGAATAFEELLTDQVRVLGPDHPNTLATRANLAYWRGKAGDPAGAATAFEELLTDHLRVFGPEHPDTLATRNNLASLRGDAGDPAGAATATEELLTDQLRVLGPEHPNTLITRNNLASLRGDAGDPAGAATATEELLTDRIRVLGPDHPNTLATRANLAYWRGEAGDPAGAATAFEELLTDHLRVFGPEHPDTLATRANLAYWRGDAGDPAGAATATEELLTDQLRVLGPEHPNTLITRNNLASLRGDAGDPAGAATAFEELLTDHLRVLGPDHPNTLITRSNLAYWRGEAGDPAGAATAFEELLTDQLRVLGPEHPNTLATRNNLAYWRGEAGDPAGAATATEELLTDQLRVLGPDHPNTLATRANLAYWRGKAGDPAGAATAFEELLTDQLRVLGPEHPNTLVTRNNLAYWRESSSEPQVG
ncbi:hypothetical protein GCM10009779_03210 [Polymorphospora rubra]